MSSGFTITGRVFLLENTRHDVSAARSHGQVVTLFGPENRSKLSFWTPDYGTSVVCELLAAGFDPERDVICVAGHMVGITGAIAAIAARFKRFKLLQWEPRSQSYVLVEAGDTTQ
jgi:hypothetical protein